MHKVFFRRLVLAASIGAALAYAVETKTWSQSSQAEFEKGNLKKLSLRSDGRLSLAPAVKEILDSSTPYLWAAAEDSRGNLYVGGGGPGGGAAKLFVIDSAGQSKTLTEFEATEIHAIAVDRKDQVFVATAPDGKVYRVAAGGKSETFYDPKAKYIWSLAFNSRGDLFVATGDQGEIHRVAADGKGSVFFKTEETHARSLAIDARDNLIVGTEPSGLVLRVSPSGDGFVLYQGARREITAVAIGRDGAIYATGVGSKQPSTAPGLPVPAPATSGPAPTTPVPPGGPAVAGRPQVAPPPTFAIGGAPVAGGSELYRILPDGSPRRIWSHAQEIAYAIAFDEAGRPLIGTGNKGGVYRIDTDYLSTLLWNAAPTQVTAFSASRAGQVFAVTGNIGKVYRIGPGLEREGSFESEAFDGSSFARWGRLAFRGDTVPGAILFETRSGNLDRPQRNWSPWQPLSDGRIVSPAARFLQWRATFAGGAQDRSPEIRSVDVAYLPKNVAPRIEEIEVTPANYRFPQQSLSITPSTSLTLPPLGRRRNPTPTASIDIGGGSQTMQYAKGHIGVRWLAGDDNGDALQAKVEIRGVQEQSWKLLKDKVRERYLSWDSTAFPDGRYLIRVTLSDLPDNPPDQALSASLDGDPFVIDNAPPQITGLRAEGSPAQVSVRWKASDALGVISSAEYSVNGGDWTVVEPTTKLTDSREHDYVLVIDRAGTGEQTIAVRVSDEYDNQAVDKVVVR